VKLGGFGSGVALDVVDVDVLDGAIAGNGA